MSKQKTKHKITLNVNGKPYRFGIEPNKTLIDILRAELKLGGTKEGCGVGKCGTCAVIMDGKTVPSCMVLAVEADDTIEASQLTVYRQEKSQLG